MTALLAIVFAALVINVGLAMDNTVYHIKPTLASPCPHLQCKTLDVIARYPNLLFGYWKRNVSLIFLPGAHKLSEKMTATDLYNLDLKLKVLSGRVDINCENGAYISLSGSGRVSFEGLHFSNCGGWDNGPYVPMRNPGVYIFFIGVVTVSSCSFRSTKEDYTFESKSSETLLFNSTFTNSVKVYSRTFNFNEKRKGNLTISNCMFQGDYSSQGGALYIKNLLRANITNSVFRSSVANTGSVYIQDSGVSFSNVIFQNNSAFYCAAVYMESSDVNITTTLLSDNMAHCHAVLCVAYSNLRMGNVSITHNVAKLNGTGGIFAARSTEWNWWYICSPQH